MKQPEAILLAEAMSLAFPGNKGIDKAAAELRRLHEENKAMSETSSQIIADNMRLHEANQAMLEALKELQLAVNSAINFGDWVVDGSCDPDACLMRVDAAIAKGEQS